MGALESEISGVCVKEAEIETFLLENKSRVLSLGDIKERARYLPVFPENVKLKTDSSCIKSGKPQLVSCAKEDGVYRVGFLISVASFYRNTGTGC